MDFNPKAEKHPCMKCEHGGTWTEKGGMAGNICKHPEITRQHGLFYGKFHTLKIIPKWCPLKEKEALQ